MTALEKELIDALRQLFANANIDLGELVYQVREREGLGWDSPSVKHWSDAVATAKALLKRIDEGEES